VVSERLGIGVDVGGTKLAAGLVAADGEVLDRARWGTPGEPGAILAGIIKAVSEIEGRHAVRGLPVGVGIAGIVDRRGVARYTPNLPLIDRPVLDELRQGLSDGGEAAGAWEDRLVTVDNDATVAAWGEYRVGAGAGAASSLLMLTVGTGVGGGLVLDGRLVRGAHGFAAEFGHIIVSEGGPECACGNRGCLEALASGTALGRFGEEALAAGAVPPGSALYALGASPKASSGAPSAVTGLHITGKSVTVAAQAGDQFAIELLARCGFWLGVGLASLVNALDPEIVVIGGGVSDAGELLLKPARAAMADRLIGAGHRPVPPVASARLGNDAGLIGAALLALGQPEEDPAFGEKS